MEHDDAQALIKLLEQLRDVQVENLEVQRKLLEIVAAQGKRSEELSERTRLLQDRSMDTLVSNRRFVFYGLPIAGGIGLFFLWALASGYFR